MTEKTRPCDDDNKILLQSQQGGSIIKGDKINQIDSISQSGRLPNVDP